MLVSSPLLSFVRVRVPLLAIGGLVDVQSDTGHAIESKVRNKRSERWRESTENAITRNTQKPPSALNGEKVDKPENFSSTGNQRKRGFSSQLKASINPIVIPKVGGSSPLSHPP
ncbi:hypothetical protein RB4218 [Rhodopirellula baltica SH 1]|uniref:Uncharacterized protein n=1 Tax=Rhodopirellula baltica (strain DSM 10527 / NCIMB 13988 / SH1) TaxID=243090 RepID=Q7USZ2_RHOBA|nr:hypothetical protein RB4218 [Rhodopirellula baltica SH 1]